MRQPVARLVPVLLLAAAACSSDSTGGTAGQLDGIALNADLQALQAPLQTASAVSFELLVPLVAERLLPAAPRGADEPALRIPAPLLGGTYTWSAGQQRYERSTLAGAPADGVRFLLYSTQPGVNPPVPVVPLAETGRLELTRTTGGGRAVVTSTAATGSVPTVDYSAVRTGSGADTTRTLTGSLLNGSARGDFTAVSTVSQQGSQRDFSFDLAIPGGGRQFTYTQREVGSGAATTVTTDVQLTGSVGALRIRGTTGPQGGTLTVDRNGAPFAVITFSATGGGTVADTSGRPLAAADIQALNALLALRGRFGTLQLRLDLALAWT